MKCKELGIFGLWIVIVKDVFVIVGLSCGCKFYLWEGVGLYNVIFYMYYLNSDLVVIVGVLFVS